MSTRSLQVITLSSVNLADDKKHIWKEFGSYLDKRVDITKDTSKSDLILNSLSYLSTNLVYKICNSCSRPIGEKLLPSHYAACVEMRSKIDKKKRKFEDDSQSIDRERTIENTSQSTSRRDSQREREREIKLREEASNSDSREVSNSQSEDKPKKKYKKSQAQKEKEAANAAAAASSGRKDIKKRRSIILKTKNNTGKPKGPLDIEKQCGVPLPSGGFCARSLTCKTHSMGAKRAVPGRSAPYDVLLTQYQKRNQAKIAASNALAVQRQENEEFDDSELDNGLFQKIHDPDEETHLVLEGLSKNNPQPLEPKIYLPVRNRHRFLGMREAYANALIITGNSNQNKSSDSSSSEQTLANQAISGSIGGLQGRCALINVDMNTSSSNSSTQSYSAIPGEIYQVRAPSKAINMTSQYNQLQTNLFQQQIQKLQQQNQQQMALMRQRQQAIRSGSETGNS